MLANKIDKKNNAFGIAWTVIEFVRKRPYTCMQKEVRQQ